MEKLVLARSDLSLMDVYGLRLYGVQKWFGVIRVLRSFSYKDLSKILAKFEFMMGGCKVESERDYQVSILDKNFISNMETNRWQHVRVNSPIYLSITEMLSLQWEQEAVRFGGLFLLFFFLSLAGFLYFKGRLWKASKREEFNKSFSYFWEY